MRKATTLLVIFLIAFTMSACSTGKEAIEPKKKEESNNSEKKDSSATDEQEKKENESSKEVPYFEDDVIETSEAKIKLTGYDFLPAAPKKGQPSDLFIITYNFTNTSDTEQRPTVVFPANTVFSQNDEMLLPGITLNHKYSEGLANILLNVKPGETVKCAGAYSLKDTTSPVLLTVNDGILGEELGKKTYENEIDINQ